MKHIYRLTLFNLKRTFMFGMILFLFGSLSAQMSGTYTLNASGTASSSNFLNWPSFVNSLYGTARTDGGPNFTGGVSGPVTLTVQSSLTNTASIVLNAITGASSTNRITIQGGANFVSYAGTSANPEVFLFNGADWVTINNLVIRNTGTVGNIMGIRYTNASDNNTLSNSTVEFSALTTGTTAGGAFVCFSTTTTLSSTTAGTGTNGYFNTIINNLMRTTNTNSPGPTFGIFEVQNTSNYTSTASNNSFIGNTIQNFFLWGINVYYTNGTQLVRNDISRANNTGTLPSSTAGGIQQYFVYSTSRRIRVDSNFVHDLPFVNANPASSNSNNWGIWVWYNYGSSTRVVTCNNNRVTNIMAATNTNGVYNGYNSWCDMNNNLVDNHRTNANANMFALYNVYGDNANMNNNVVQNCRPFGTFYGIYTFGLSNSTTNRMYNNRLINNVSTTTSTYHIMYGIYNANGLWDVQRNIISNLNQITTAGYIYGFWAQINGANQTWGSNIASNLGGSYGTYGLYHNTVNGTFTFKQNTLNLNSIGGGYTWHYGYTIYGFGSGTTIYDGNIIATSNMYGAYPLYFGTNTNTVTFRNNTWWTNGLSFQNWYSPTAGFVANFNAMVASGWGGFTNDIHRNPRFKNVAALDFRADDFLSQNNVPTTANVPQDFAGLTRNVVNCDRGAMQNTMDLALTSATYNGGTNPCTGYRENLRITVRNNYLDTARNFRVSFSLNGVRRGSEVISSTIAPGQSLNYTFTTPLHLTIAGNQRLAVYLDIPDDVRNNDSSVWNLTVRKSPGGGVFSASAKPTKALYRPNRPSDVTVVGEPVIYNVTPPTQYNNASYGTSWTINSAYVMTRGGAMRPSSEVKFTAPSGSNNLEVQWLTNDRNIEDTTVFVNLAVRDITTGCDTIIRREVLLYPKIVPDFRVPSKICDGDDVAFEQRSTVRSGGMEFLWNFGTGVAADTSNAPEPVFRFPAAGKYRVVMIGRTLPFGFESYDTTEVTVGPVPAVKFTKVNACEGNDVVFTNQTTPSTGVLNTWNFGDGRTRVDGNTTVLHRYNTAGAYTVTLNANLNGCISSASQRVYQFPKPKAAYTLTAGKCDNDKFTFVNGTTIASGSWGPVWRFGDGNVSTEDNPVHSFTASGDKSVKLIAISEFGCRDSVTKTVSVLESPKVSFVNSATCSRTPTSFTNTTPVVSGPGGVVKKYDWNFGDGTTSAAENPNKSWTAIGPRTVTFSVELDNGCKNVVTKDIFVGVQPRAAFTAQDVCFGQPMTFVNSTTWPQGEISYLWNFGDGTTSNSANPVKTYNKAFSPNITLYASIKGGCSDSVVIPVNIFEGPRTCDFAVNTDYAYGFYGIRVEPLNENTGIAGGQANVEYSWIFAGGGTVKTNGISAAANHNFQADGSYTVTMRARSTSSPFCECSKTKQVVMNRANATQLQTAGITLFPNPNNGQFNLMLTEGFGQQLSIEMMNASGSVVKTLTAENTGNINLDAGDLSDGTYMLRVSSSLKTATIRVAIRRN